MATSLTSSLSESLVKHQETLATMEAKYHSLTSSIQSLQQQERELSKPQHHQVINNVVRVSTTPRETDAEANKDNSEAFGYNAVVPNFYEKITPVHKNLDNDVGRNNVEEPFLWLLIGISTVARSHKEEYLLSVLSELNNQLEPSMSSRFHPFHDQVKVLIRWGGDAKSRKPHPIFNQAQLQYKSKDNVFLFDDGTSATNTIFNGSPLSSSNTQNTRRSLRSRRDIKQNPFYKPVNEEEIFNQSKHQRRRLMSDGDAPVNGAVKAQTRDVISLLRTALNKQIHFKYFLFMEDDFKPCHDMLFGIYLLYNRAQSDFGDHNWGMLRLSYGLNGIIVHRESLSEIIQFFNKRIQSKPPDHLLLDWVLQSSRPSQQQQSQVSIRKKYEKVVAFKHNLFYHLGLNSIVGNSNSRYIPACYDLLYDWLRPEERFDIETCQHDYITPCHNSGGKSTYQQGGDVVGGKLDVGYHISTSPKTKKPFSCKISLQDEPLLFSSARYKSCTSSKSAHAILITKPAVNINDMKGLLGEKGEDCDTVCKKQSMICDKSGLPLLNSKEEISKIVPGCHDDNFELSKGKEQPAIENNDIAIGDSLRCLINRGPLGSCRDKHVKTSRLCPCFPQP